MCIFVACYSENSKDETLLARDKRWAASAPRLGKSYGSGGGRGNGGRRNKGGNRSRSRVRGGGKQCTLVKSPGGAGGECFQEQECSQVFMLICKK